jgi:hypothetical protein
VFPVMYELSFHIPEDGTLHSHRRENLKSYTLCITFLVFHLAVNAVDNRFLVFFILITRTKTLVLLL